MQTFFRVYGNVIKSGFGRGHLKLQGEYKAMCSPCEFPKAIFTAFGSGALFIYALVWCNLFNYPIFLIPRSN